MSQNTEFLNYIYQNSQMGIDTINQLNGIVKDQEFSHHLSNQLQEYQNINSEAISRLHENGEHEQDIGKVAELSAYMSIGLKTIKDRSPEHISEMMIDGSTKGVVDVTRNLKKYTDAEEATIALGNRLLKTEQNNINDLKSYL